MATSDIEKVLTVFQGIGARDADLATKLIGNKECFTVQPFVAGSRRRHRVQNHLRKKPPRRAKARRKTTNQDYRRRRESEAFSRTGEQDGARTRQRNHIFSDRR